MTTNITLTEDHYCINYANEFDFRDGLARVAYLCGWDVETEHVVPGWGRPDLYLSAGKDRVAVELKVDLTTASRCRKAIQQSDIYRKAMPEVSEVILCAPHINRELMGPYMAAYPSVWVKTINEFVKFLEGSARTMDSRHRLAWDRYQDTARELEVHRRVLTALSNYVVSPVGVNVREPMDAAAAATEFIDGFFGSFGAAVESGDFNT